MYDAAVSVDPVIDHWYFKRPDGTWAYVEKRLNNQGHWYLVSSTKTPPFV